MEDLIATIKNLQNRILALETLQAVPITGGGDMMKATYDANANNIVDKAEAIDDGAGHTANATEIEQAVTDDHTHTNKTLLDTYSQTEANLSDAVTKKHVAVTISDTASVDLSLTGQQISATVLPAGVDHGGLGGLTDDDHTIYSKADGSRPFTNPVGGVTPVAVSDLATKEYVDLVASAIQLSEYLHDTASDLGGIYKTMESTESGAGTVVSSTISSNTTTNIFNFATLSGQPHLDRLTVGVYDLHCHLKKTGNRTTTVYGELYKRVLAGTETLLGTSNSTTALTTGDVEYPLNITIGTEVALLTTDRLVIKFYAVTANPAGDTTVTMTVGGTADPHFGINIQPIELTSVFVPYTGAESNLDLGTQTLTTSAVKITTGAGANKVLTSDADGDATWEAPATSVSVTTKGDLQTYSTTPDRLPVGADGKVLKANSATATGLEWGDATGGGGGTVSIVPNEVPTGLVNGSNTSYTTANTFATGLIEVYLNGQKQTLTGDFTIKAGLNGFDMVTAPLTGDVLTCTYFKDNGSFAGSDSFIYDEVPSGAVDSSNVTFILANTPIAGTLMLFRDGQLLVGGSADYTLATATITFVTAPVTGSILKTFYQKVVTSAGNADTLDGFHLSTITDTALTGWYSITDSWAYASADAPTFTITVPSGAASKYTVGMRVKLTQTTVKYFIITAVADTVLTVYGGTDYTLANAAISAISVSNVKAPLGFPLSPIKWTVETRDVGSRTQTTPSASTWYNLGSVTISIPIGVWSVNYQANLYAWDTSAIDVSASSTLSTANNSQSDIDFTCRVDNSSPTGSLGISATVNRTKTLTIATKTSYYFNSLVAGATAEGLRNQNDISPLIIRAVSAYL